MRLGIYVFAAALVLSASWGETAKPPEEAFGQLPALSGPAISPDGRHMAVIKPYKGRPALVIYDLDNDAADPTVLPCENGFIIAAVWKTDRRLLVTFNMNVKRFGSEMAAYYRLIAVDLDGRNSAEMLSKLPSAGYNYSVATISDLSIDDPDHIYMPFWEKRLNKGFRRDLLKVDVRDGSAELYVQGTEDTDAFLMDGRGSVVGKIEEEKQPLVDRLYVYRQNEWRLVDKTAAAGGDGIAIAGITEDGQSLIRYAKSEKDGRRGLIATRLDDLEGKPFYFDAKYDIGGTLHDPWTDRVVGVSVVSDAEHDIYFSPALQALQHALEAVFPGKTVHAVSWDRAVQRVIVHVSAPQYPAVYFLLDRRTHAAQRIARTYPELTEADLGEMKPYPYKARDGLDIPAYLTLPPGKAAKNLPAVILPHGGPMARDQIGFDWMAQFLANRGYAVLQPNFRGSTGYGKAFEEAGYGQWGLKMQDDLTDGVRKLVTDGVADPKRICIVGASYGGYAALAGATFTPDLYACAFSWAGVTDLRLFLNSRASDFGQDSWMISSWSRFIGDRWNDAEKLDAASPAENAGHIECPILLMHGTADVTVRIDQSETMKRALERAGKKVVFVPVKGETHYMQTADTRILVLTQLEKFLAETIGK